MRPSNKRSRNKQNRPRTLGNIVNRVFDSSGPEGKVRGTPQQIIDKYTLLARDAQLSGDRVAAENFLQHAEHYTRMLNEAQAELAREAEMRPQQGGNNGQNASQNGNQNGGQNRRYDPRDEDGETEAGDALPAFLTRSEPRQNEPRQPEQRQNEQRQNEHRQGEARQPEQRQNEQRQPEQRQGEARQGDGRNDWKERRNRRFDERRNRREGGDPRDEAPRNEGESDSNLVETPEQRRPEPAAAQPAEPVIQAPRDPVPEAAPEAAAPRPRGRPRKPRSESTAESPVAEAPAPDTAG